MKLGEFPKILKERFKVQTKERLIRFGTDKELFF